MFKRFLCATLAMIICSTALINISAFAAAVDDTPIYEIVDYYVPKEKETGYDDIRYAEETQKYSDVSEGDNRTINILSALKLTDSLEFEENAVDDESTDNAEAFKPDEEISRGEFVAMAARLINAQDYSQNDKLWFSDVPRDSRFYSEISGMAAMGIVGGYGDGTFCPDKKISYEETISVMMKALGYGVAAELKGGMSTGYRKTASQIGLTDGLTVKNESEMSRIEAVRLMYNALDCPIYKAVSFGDSVRYETDENCTALSEYHKIYKTEDYVNATLVSALSGYSPTDSEHILVGDLSCKADKNKYAEYLGYYVEMYYKDDGSSEREIVYLAPDEKQEKLVIKADDIASFKNLTYTYGDKNRKVSIGKNHTLIVNGRRMTEYDEAAFVPHNGEVILLSTDSGRYDTVIVNTFRSLTVQRAQNGGGETATFTSKYTYQSFKVDMSKEDLCFSIYVDGERFNFEKINYQTNTDNFFDDKDYTDTPVTTHTTYSFPFIPVGAVAEVYADEYELMNGLYIPAESARYIKIYISTKSIEGTVTKISDKEETVTIDGKDYKIAYENSLKTGNETFKVGSHGRFVLDSDGKVAAWLADIYADDDYRYGYLINAVKNGGAFSNTIKTKVLKSDGKIEILNVDEKVRLNSETIKEADELLKRLGESAAMLDSTFKISQIIKYKLSDKGTIKELQTVMQSVGLPDGADEHQLNRDMERTRLSHEMNMLHINGGTEKYPNAARLYSQSINTVHFVVPPTETFDDDDYWIQDTWRINFSQQSWLYNGWKSVDVFDCNEFRAPGAIVIYDKPENSEFLQGYVMVQEITDEISQAGTEIHVLRGYDGWGSVAYYSDNPKMFDGLKRGDFVLLFGTREKVSKVNMIVSVDEVKNCDLSTVPESFNYGIFEVYSKNTSKKNMVLQRGPITANGKRTLQFASSFRSSGGPSGGAKAGALYYGEGRNAVFSYFYSGIRDSFSDINTVLEVGTEKATRVYVRDEPGMTAIIIYDLED